MADKGLKNTRLKDYYDVWKLSQQFEFDGETLIATIRATFARRQTPLPIGIPLALSEQFVNDRLVQWQSFLRKNALRDHQAELAEVVAAIVRFLLPLTEAMHANERFAFRWSSNGQ